MLGLYEKALPALRTALQHHLTDTNPLADAPSVRLCRFAVLELEDMLSFGTQAVHALVSPANREQASAWLELLMMFYRRLREIDVPEMMASILTETPGKPWEYYRDACRCWGVKPDPEVLAYSTSYESVRADLKTISASA